MLTLPATIYLGFVDHGSVGIGNTGDFVTSLDQAADVLAEYPEARIYQIDHDFATNLPESIRDVTEDVALHLNARWHAVAAE